MPDPSSTCLLFSAISEGSGETAWMCRLAWSFPARICNKYLNHMKWYRQLCLTLHLRVFFLVQSVKALAKLCKYAVSPDHLLFAYATSTKLCLHPFFAVRMCSPARSFTARICDKNQSFWNWPIILGLSHHLHPFFLVRFPKPLVILRKFAVSSDPFLFDIVYAINTKLAWTGP